jgi:hypothetical protein
MEQDWDNLVILDACRYDTFAEVNEIDGELSMVKTRGTNTGEFIRENFRGESFYDTVYVSGNSAVGAYSEYVDVHELIGVWKARNDDLDWEDRPEIAHPETMVEHALEAAEEYDDKRLIVHFLQPHCPYLIKDGEPLDRDSVYRYIDVAVESGVSEAEIRAVYQENVEYVLEYAEELVEQLSGKTVITADHGELLGTAVNPVLKAIHPRSSFFTGGWRYRYGHERSLRVPALAEVPWLELDFEERRTITAEEPTEKIDFDREVIEEQLEVLGYR